MTVEPGDKREPSLNAVPPANAITHPYGILCGYQAGCYDFRMNWQFLYVHEMMSNDIANPRRENHANAR